MRRWRCSSSPPASCAPTSPTPKRRETRALSRHQRRGLGGGAAHGGGARARGQDSLSQHLLSRGGGRLSRARRHAAARAVGRPALDRGRNRGGGGAGEAMKLIVIFCITLAACRGGRADPELAKIDQEL